MTWHSTKAAYESQGRMDVRCNEHADTWRAVGADGSWLDPSGQPAPPPRGDGWTIERLLMDGWRYVQPGHEADPHPPPAYPTGWQVSP